MRFCKNAAAAVTLVCVAVLFSSTNGFSQKKTMKGMSSLIERGKYLTTIGSCEDCHSPKVFTPMGPIPDTSKTFSGAPAGAKVPEVPKGVLAPDQWGGLGSNDFTTWAGPWGISFAANLTPDMETGIGSWTEDIFVKALRTGKHLGEGRDILPPMPWPMIGQMTDEDLKAVFAYLKSLKPISNAVPDPISPTGETIPTPRHKQ